MVGQVLQRLLKLTRCIVCYSQRLDRLLAPGIGPAFTKLNQAQKDPPGNALLAWSEFSQPRT